MGPPQLESFIPSMSCFKMVPLLFVGEGSIGVPKRLRGADEIGWNIDEDATCKQQPRGSNDAGS
jgi:hypothetical protein